MTQPAPPAYARTYAWFSAVMNDDTDLITDLLAYGFPIDTPHPLRHSTALMEATRLGRVHMVQWLLDHGAAPAFLCGLPVGTSLHCALRRHHWPVATILANAMASCAVMDAFGATPLHILCTEVPHPAQPQPMAQMANLLIAKQCPLDALDHDGTTALHHCVINGHEQLAALLLRHGANPNALIPDSHVSPLAIAALEKNLPMAKLLLAHGANPHQRTTEGSSPLSLYAAIAPLVKQRATQPASDGAVY
jgi:ankyrin repeat protein